MVLAAHTRSYLICTKITITILYRKASYPSQVILEKLQVLYIIHNFWWVFFGVFLLVCLFILFFGWLVWVLFWLVWGFFGEFFFWCYIFPFLLCEEVSRDKNKQKRQTPPKIFFLQYQHVLILPESHPR